MCFCTVLKLVLADNWQISPLALPPSVLQSHVSTFPCIFLFSSDLEVKELWFQDRQEVPQCALRIYPKAVPSKGKEHSVCQFSTPCQCRDKNQYNSVFLLQIWHKLCQPMLTETGTSIPLLLIIYGKKNEREVYIHGFFLSSHFSHQRRNETQQKHSSIFLSFLVLSFMFDF